MGGRDWGFHDRTTPAERNKTAEKLTSFERATRIVEAIVDRIGINYHKCTKERWYTCKTLARGTEREMKQMSGTSKSSKTLNAIPEFCSYYTGTSVQCKKKVDRTTQRSRLSPYLAPNISVHSLPFSASQVVESYPQHVKLKISGSRPSIPFTLASPTPLPLPHSSTARPTA